MFEGYQFAALLGLMFFIVSHSGQTLHINGLSYPDQGVDQLAGHTWLRHLILTNEVPFHL